MHQTTPSPASGVTRRHMHTRTVTCESFLRDDGLWEVEARLVDTKPFAQRDPFRGPMEAGTPVHDIRLRIAIDDTLVIREAQATMASVPYPSCVDVEGILQRLVGERIGKGWRDIVKRKMGRLETCTHLSELLGPAVTTLFQTLSYGRDPGGKDTYEEQQRDATEPPFYVNGCYSWRLDGPVVARVFPQFSTAPKRE